MLLLNHSPFLPLGFIFSLLFSANVAAFFYPDEFIIKLKDDISFNKNEKDYFLKTTQVTPQKITSIKIADATFLSVKLRRDDLPKITELKINAFEYIEPNYRWKILTADEKYKDQWNLENSGNNYPNPFTHAVKGADIDIVRAWKLTTGSREIKIAIIDTGIDYTHPDLIQNIWTNERELNGMANIDDDENGYIDDIHGYNFIKNSGNPFDDQGHGTHCAGIIGATHNNIGIAGIMPNVSLIAL